MNTNIIKEIKRKIEELQELIVRLEQPQQTEEKKLRYINLSEGSNKDKLDRTLSKILCKWKQDSVVGFFLYLDSVFKNKHKLIHNQAPVVNRLCPFLLNLHK